MNTSLEYVNPESLDRYRLVEQMFLPNEIVEVPIETDDGFIILTNRRLISVKSKRGNSDVQFEKVFRFDMVQDVEAKKKDKWQVVTLKPNLAGEIIGKMKKDEIIYDTNSFDVSPAKYLKDDGKRIFTSGMEALQQGIELRKSQVDLTNDSLTLDCSYTMELSLDIDESSTGLHYDLWKDVNIGKKVIIFPGSHVLALIDEEKTMHQLFDVSGRMVQVTKATGSWFNHSLLCCITSSEILGHLGVGVHFFNQESNNTGVQMTTAIAITFEKLDASKLRNGDRQGMYEEVMKTSAIQNGPAPWILPLRNRQWIVADAYSHMTGKRIPSSKPTHEPYTPRFW